MGNILVTASIIDATASSHTITTTATATSTASISALTATSTTTGIMITSGHFFRPLCPLGREASLDCSTQETIMLSLVALEASCVLVCIIWCLCRMRQDRPEGQNT